MSKNPAEYLTKTGANPNTVVLTTQGVYSPLFPAFRGKPVVFNNLNETVEVLEKTSDSKPISATLLPGFWGKVAHDLFGLVRVDGTMIRRLGTSEDQNERCTVTTERNGLYYEGDRVRKTFRAAAVCVLLSVASFLTGVNYDQISKTNLTESKVTPTAVSTGAVSGNMLATGIPTTVVAPTLIEVFPTMTATQDPCTRSYPAPSCLANQALTPTPPNTSAYPAPEQTEEFRPNSLPYPAP